MVTAKEERRYREAVPNDCGAARRPLAGGPPMSVGMGLGDPRNHLWHFLPQEFFVDNIFKLFGELGVQQMLNQFFDRAIYYSILAYHEEVRHYDPDRTGRDGRFIAGTLGSA